MAEFEKWRAALSPTRVDIVSDFAGRGLFAIHGEAMLTHCLENARVDFDCESLHFYLPAAYISSILLTPSSPN